jgi:hypothetical protein
MTRWLGIPWERQQSASVVCFGKIFDSNGNTGAYAFASIPLEKDTGWVPAPGLDIAFDHKSRLHGPDRGPPVCARKAGDFTYFQTAVELARPATTFQVSIQNVEDGVQVMLFNSRTRTGKSAASRFSAARPRTSRWTRSRGTTG